MHVLHTEPEPTGADAIAAAARQVAETLDVAAIVCWTSSGATGMRVSRERPRSPIIAISPMVGTGRKLSLVWGIHCVVAEDARDQDDMVGRACEIANREDFAKAGERVIIVAGPLGHTGCDEHDTRRVRCRRERRRLAARYSIGAPAFGAPFRKPSLISSTTAAMRSAAA